MSPIFANWPAPATISALTTSRAIGYSQPPYDSNNLALHVNDNPHHVHQNRRALIESLRLPGEPAWLDQIHSNQCVVIEEETNRVADAAITRQRETPLVIMTADCLPILLCDRLGTEIAAIHAGWRGLLDGVIENTVEKMHSHPDTLLAWIGPAICQNCYQTGYEVALAFLERYPITASAFRRDSEKHYANLPSMAELILNQAGIANVYQSGACTFELENQCFSYRRQAQTGRIASLIWFNTP